MDGALGRSYFYYTTNGVTNPTLHMRPGEVQRWRLLNASDSDNLLVALQGHGLNIVAMDGITVANMYHLKTGAPVVMGAGQRYDVLVKAGNPGTYQLQALDWTTNPESVSPSPQNIDPEQRTSQHSFDFPTPCVATGPFACPPPIQQTIVPSQPRDRHCRWRSNEYEAAGRRFTGPDGPSKRRHDAQAESGCGAPYRLRALR